MSAGISASESIGVNAVNRLGLRIDRIDRAVELGVNQVAEDVVADGAGAGRCPDDGDRLRVKYGVELGCERGVVLHVN